MEASKIEPRPVLLEPKVITRLTLWQRFFRWLKVIGIGRKQKLKKKGDRNGR